MILQNKLTKEQKKALFDKHVHKIDLKKHVLITHIFLIATTVLCWTLLGILWYTLFFQYINFTKPINDVSELSLNLTGKDFGFYHISGYNNIFELGWLFWSCFGIFVSIILLFSSCLILDHNWHFRLAKHKISYFLIVPLILLSTLTWVTAFFAIPKTYNITLNVGGVCTSFENIISRFVIVGNDNEGWKYDNVFTPLGFAIFVISIFILFYEIKMTSAFFYELKTKWGSNVHLTNHDKNKTLQQIFHHKKIVCFYFSLIDILITLFLIITILSLIFFEPHVIKIFYDEQTLFYIRDIFIPCICGIILLSDILGFVYLLLSMKNKDEERHKWMDILLIIFGGILTSVAGIILLTDFYYARIRANTKNPLPDPSSIPSAFQIKRKGKKI
ncbi:MAG: hypothetical protein LBB39_01450 [Mycoplasmataceae bacterium]|nr:hypothetical protein [Mycoplasmataceae bacterium]